MWQNGALELTSIYTSSATVKTFQAESLDLLLDSSLSSLLFLSTTTVLPKADLTSLMDVNPCSWSIPYPTIPNFQSFNTIYVLAGSYWQNFTVVEGWLVKDLLTANSFMVCLDIRIFGLCLSVQEYGSSSETSAVYSMKFSWRCLFSAWHSSWWCNFLLLGSCYVFPFLHGLWN